jgi:hypothetical protein
MTLFGEVAEPAHDAPELVQLPTRNALSQELVGCVKAFQRLLAELDSGARQVYVDLPPVVRIDLPHQQTVTLESAEKPRHGG